MLLSMVKFINFILLAYIFLVIQDKVLEVHVLAIGTVPTMLHCATGVLEEGPGPALNVLVTETVLIVLHSATGTGIAELGGIMERDLLPC